jgi:hypothetical protein
MWCPRRRVTWEEGSIRAHTGDWLIVKCRSDISAARRAIVLEAHGPEGSAPFLVRSIGSGDEALVFPGPDAVIVSAAEQSERDRATGRSNLISGHPG